MKERKVLILAFKYPPYAGVGARRWAKFSKYLSREGFGVHIICAKWRGEESDSWTSDTLDPRIRICRLPYLFFGKYRKGKIGDLIFKVEILVSKFFGWTDEAYGFYVQNFSKIERYLKRQQISTVIATGGPFSTNYFASKLKKKYPELKLIQDFRDPWIADYFYANPGEDPEGRRFHNELKMEKFALEHADSFLSVTPGYIERFEDNAVSYKLGRRNFLLIENGFDSDDRMVFSESEFPYDLFQQSDLNVVHFGTVQFGREKPFFRFLKDNAEKLRSSGSKIKFHFFGSFQIDVKNEILASDFSSFVRFHEFVKPKEVQRFMYFADMHMVLNDEIYFYAFGTKVYDAFMYRKPVFLLSKVGELYKLIKENNLGLVSDNSAQENTVLMNQLIENREEIKKGLITNSSYNFEQHSIGELTKKLVAIINDP